MHRKYGSIKIFPTYLGRNINIHYFGISLLMALTACRNSKKIGNENQKGN
jgi:hypothetical protein